jgi:hypothetical protein
MKQSIHLARIVQLSEMNFGPKGLFHSSSSRLYPWST